MMNDLTHAPTKRLCLLGLGLIGGSVALAMRENSPEWRCVGWDRDAETCRLALEREAVTEIFDSPERAVTAADVVVLAVPVGAVIPLLRQIAPHLPETTVVTDVASTKARIVGEAEFLLGGGFVGGHPMAGSEQSGLSAAVSTLFRNATWLLTPTLQTKPDALAVVQNLVERMGATPRLLEPRTHDRLTAHLSHLSHLLAYGLTQTASDQLTDDLLPIPGGSFRDGTRVAKSDPAFWSAILRDNRAAVLESLDEMIHWLGRARTALREEDDAPLVTLLTEARNARRRFPF